MKRNTRIYRFYLMICGLDVEIIKYEDRRKQDWKEMM